MRILYVSFYAPPFNNIAAVRAGKIAKYLHALGDEVRLLGADDPPVDPPGDRSLAIEVPPECIRLTKWWSINGAVEAALRRVRGGGTGVSPTGRVTSLEAVPAGLRSLALFVASATHIPDPYAAWYPSAVREALRWLSDGWRPDLIYASGAPVTAFLVARRLGGKLGVPWVAELRDLWAENPNYVYQSWRRQLDVSLESRVLGSAAGLVTVSEPLRESLRARFSCPTAVVTNGFDPDDYPSHRAPSGDGPLHLVYTGRVYPGKQDLGLLFEALGRREAADVTVDLYLRGDHDQTLRQIREYGVEARVRIRQPVCYRDALAEQSRADALLLANWGDAKERGVLTGKFFEYAGARRPILAIGPTDNVVTELIRERGLGESHSEVDGISQALDRWVARKREAGVPGLAGSEIDDFSREYQTRILREFLCEVLGRG